MGEVGALCAPQVLGEEQPGEGDPTAAGVEAIADALRRVVAPQLQALTADELASVATANARTAELLAGAPHRDEDAAGD